MNVHYYFRDLLLLYSLCKPWTLHDVKMHPHINSYILSLSSMGKWWLLLLGNLFVSLDNTCLLKYC